MSQWVALLITLAFEIPIVVLWIRRAGSTDLSPSRVAAIAAAATLLTHPFAWYFNGALTWPFAARAALVETFAVAVEALIYARFLDVSSSRAALLSLVANAASFGGGLALWWFFFR